MASDGSSPSSISPAEPVTRARRTRTRIAVLIDNIDHVSGGYEPQLRAAFDASCRERDIDLVIVVGRAFDHPESATAAQNHVYELLDRTSCDGVIFLSSGLAAFTGPERIAGVHTRLSPRAACSIGMEVPGVTSVLVDNRPGMDALLEHVIVTHGRRKLAFVAGTPKNPDGEVRFAAYRDALARHGIAYDPRLVVWGNFHTPTAARAASDLLDRQIPFDALISANDAMALAAMDALKTYGLRVPHDVVVTGFDDLVHARLASPPLTTVRQPLERMGVEAVRLIMEQLAGKEVPTTVTLPVEFVSRESCGCSTRWMGRAPSGPYPVVDQAAPVPLASRERARLMEDVARESLEPLGPRATWIARLIEALEVELSGRAGEFLNVLEEVVDWVGDRHDGFEKLQRAVEAIRAGLRRPDLAPLWLAARAAIDAGTARAHARQRLEVDVVFQDVMRSGERLSTASLDPSRLTEVIAEEVVAMRHRNAVVSVYGSESGTLAPLIWLHDGRVEVPRATEFATSELVLPEACDRRRTWFVHALTFQTEQLGVAAFELGSGSVTVEMLRGQISTALKTAALHREIVHTTALHERSVQERLATAERMASLSVLAGGVAHDLNNSLGPLVMLPDVILGQLEELRSGRLDDDKDLVLDINTIKSSATRAAQTIKDLLMIGRPGATAKEPLDLNEAVAHCISAEPLRFLKNGRSEVTVKLELDRGPLTFMASEPHVVRALTNLVRNAAEAIVGSGEIRVSTASVRLAQPVVSQEAIPAGDYVVVRVADTGQGIPPDDIIRIFQPFFSRKTRSDESGSGLGLAIVHGVVKEHGGFVSVESRVGQGTVFTLYFRRVRAPLGAEREITPTMGGSARILVVDDEPAQLHSARRLLCQLGYRVDTLASGEAAFRIFSDARRAANAGVPRTGTPYDLVILDYALNEAHNGLETLERIRTLYPRQRGIMVSGHGRAEHEGRALARVPWLPKPYSADALAGIVRRTLDSPPL
jgi:DNA-binding LacI/PurR family transcriptional regulator/signal transduction histidine kinase